MDSEEITIYFDNNVFKLMIIGLMVDVLILIKLWFVFYPILKLKEATMFDIVFGWNNQWYLLI